jgi:hypothetical protein
MINPTSADISDSAGAQMIRRRRLVRDDDERVDLSQAMILVAMFGTKEELFGFISDFG